MDKFGIGDIVEHIALAKADTLIGQVIEAPDKSVLPATPNGLWVLALPGSGGCFRSGLQFYDQVGNWRLHITESQRITAETAEAAAYYASLTS